MKQDAIYSIAVECKHIVDEELEFYHNTKSGKFIPGKNSPLNKVLQMFCDAIKDNYPSIYTSLKKHMEEYDKNTILHIGAIDAILDCIIEIEKPKSIQIEGAKKIFISHSSDDETIIKAFIEKILLLGCGFRSDDIFCTLDHTSIRTGDDFRNEIIANMKGCDFILCFISENYKKSEICQNEMGAAWSLEDKRVLPFKFPNLSFKEIGFLNVVKQCADITDKSKLDELYNELCNRYDIEQDWLNYNRYKEDFIKTINETLVKG